MSAASEFRANCTPEEWEAYRRGYKAGYEAGIIAQLRTDDRLAFGAIRRAVAEARAYDEQAEASTWIGPKAVWRYKSSAIAIREAIRAAIGSDKA